MPMPDVRYGGLPPKEAADFFAAKQLRPAFDYRDVWREEHAISFTVAKAVQMDVLGDIQDALQESLSEGETFEQFRKSLTPKLQAAGWWGKREMTDPETGEVKMVQLGSPRRLRTIYDANIRTAHAAGQWERIQRSKSMLPYLLYELGPSKEHRPEHAAWAGIILPVDHVFWKTHFTPNGYGCKCRIRQVSRLEAERLLKSGNYTDQPPPVEYVQWLNKRTGLMEDVPKGIDPGWDTNPGWLREIGIDRAVAQKSLRLDEMDQLDAVRELLIDPVRTEQFREWVAAVRKTPAPEQMQSVGVLGNAELTHFASIGKKLDETLIAIDGKSVSTSAFTDIGMLPALLPESDAILFDAAKGHLLYLLRLQKGDWIQTLVQINVSPTEPGWAEKLNRVKSVRNITDTAASVLLNDKTLTKIK